MKNFIVKTIRVLAFIILVGGIIMFFVCKNFAWEAGIGYYKDREAVAMWNFLSVQCVLAAISSVFVAGFSYIVEAACLYIEKRNQEIYQEQNEQEQSNV